MVNLTFQKCASVIELVAEVVDAAFAFEFAVVDVINRESNEYLYGD